MVSQPRKRFSFSQTRRDVTSKPLPEQLRGFCPIVSSGYSFSRIFRESFRKEFVQFDGVLWTLVRCSTRGSSSRPAFPKKARIALARCVTVEKCTRRFDDEFSNSTKERKEEARGNLEGKARCQGHRLGLLDTPSTLSTGISLGGTSRFVRRINI